MRFVFDDQKSGKFQTMSGHCDGRCSCSVYAWFYAQKADYTNSLPLCVIDDYINKTAWVLRCLFNCDGYSRTSRSGTGKCQVPRFFIYRFTFINKITTCRLREPIGKNESRNKKWQRKKRNSMNLLRWRFMKSAGHRFWREVEMEKRKTQTENCILGNK